LKEISLPDQVNQYRWQIDAYAQNLIKNVNITCTLVGALGMKSVAAIYSSQIAKKHKVAKADNKKSSVSESHTSKPPATHRTPPKKQVHDNHPIPPATHLTPPKKQVRDNHPIPPATHLTPPKKEVRDNYPIPPTMTPSPLSKTKLDDDFEIIYKVGDTL